MLKPIIAKNINRLIARKIRTGEYKSVEHFCSSTGIHKSLMSRILNGKADMRLSSLVKIAGALEVPVRWLLKSMPLCVVFPTP